MIRVLIADDSLLTRVVLKDLLSRDPGIEVIAELADGRQAVDETLRLKPDLVIMDVMMPIMDGLDAVIEIMARCPTPILMLSANVDGTDSRSAFHAIQLGALDVMQKPQGLIAESCKEISERLIERVKALSRVRVMHHFRRSRGTTPITIAAPPLAGRPRKILAIGASTGGPKVVMRLLKELQPKLDLRIVIVQHIAHGFAEGFAEWLDRESDYTVRMASDGAPLVAGTALVAPTNRHLEVRNDRIVLSDGPLVNCCRPAVDVLFNSLAQESIAPSVAAVLLTGMGRDGADGLRALRTLGAHTIAQDEASCAVYGMPRAAVELNAACQVLAIDEIPATLSRLFV